MPEIEWNSALYDTNHSFVSAYGQDIVSLLRPKAGERILDLGCGTGTLTNQIASSLSNVVGIDASAQMIARAKANYPHISFETMDARDFHFNEPFDAIFSNATLHWIIPPEKVIACIFQQLKPGGRLVLEMGGKNNVRQIADAIHTSMVENGYETKIPNEFWYFPSLATYTTLLEKQGFTIDLAQYFERPTKLEGMDGMRNWIDMFGSFFFTKLNKNEAEAVRDAAVEILESTHYNNDEKCWYADYCRLRIKAYKR